MAKKNQAAPVAAQPAAALPDPIEGLDSASSPDGGLALIADPVQPIVGDSPPTADALPPGMVRAWVALGPILLGDGARHYKGAEIVIPEADAAAIKHHLTFDPLTL